MVPLIYAAAWSSIITLVATYSGFYYRTLPALPTVKSVENHAKSRDLRTITVPVIRNGQIRGYVSAEFSFVESTSASHEQGPDIDSYVLDEAYRLIYAETGIDFDFIQQTDLTRLISEIRSRVNSRLGKEALQDVLIRSFHYVSRDQIQK